MSFVLHSAFVAASWLVACGGRTGLDVPEPHDGGAESHDAGVAQQDTGVPSFDASLDARADASLDARVDSSPSADSSVPCSVGTVVGDVFGQVDYFAGGSSLPAGRYRVTYVDGCMKYSGGQGWTVQATAPGDPLGTFTWWLVGETSAIQILVPPGTVGYVAGSGAYDTFDACVAANLMLPPIDFDFAGGELGVWLEDVPYTDNVAGADGRNPTWKIACTN
jgi:hypothetical protein